MCNTLTPPNNPIVEPDVAFRLPTNRKFVTVALAVAAVCMASPAHAPRATAGALKAPEVTLPDLNGGKVTLNYKSARVTLVNFWAVWCFPCREEMPQITRLMEKYGKQGLKAYGIALDSGSPADVKEFLEGHKELKVSYPILLGEDDTAFQFGDIMAVPTTFLVDPAGKVLKTYVGVHSRFFEEVGAEIDKQIAAAAPPAVPPSGRVQAPPKKP